MKTTTIIYTLLGVAAAGTAGYLLYKKFTGGAGGQQKLPSYIVPGSNVVLPTGPVVKTPPSNVPLPTLLQNILATDKTITLPENPVIISNTGISSSDYSRARLTNDAGSHVAGLLQGLELQKLIL